MGTPFRRSVSGSLLRKRNRPGGFTLVELLVAISIIGLLVGIILPTVSRARSHARNIGCQTNMRTLYNACIAFAADHAGGLPSPSKTGDQPTNDWTARNCIWAMDPGKKANLKVGRDLEVPRRRPFRCKRAGIVAGYVGFPAADDLVPLGQPRSTG